MVKRSSSKRAPAKRAVTVVAAVKRDLAGLGDPDLERSGLAASALALARELDKPTNSATSKAACARALREALDRLRDLAPMAPGRDGVDELRERAARKLRPAS